MSHCDDYLDDLLALFVLINRENRKERKKAAKSIDEKLAFKKIYFHTYSYKIFFCVLMEQPTKFHEVLERMLPFHFVALVFGFNFTKTFKRPVIFNQVYYRIF